MAKREYKKAKALWEKIQALPQFHEITHEYRQKMGIPEKGFKTQEERVHFWEKVGTDEEYVALLLEEDEFVSEVTSRWPFITRAFETALLDHLFEAKAYMSRINLTGCSLGEWGDDGIQINIGPTSTLKDIHNFIDDNKFFFTVIQGKIRDKQGIRKKRVRPKQNIERDETIHLLDTWGNKEAFKAILKDSGHPELAVSNRKDQLIKSIINTSGKFEKMSESAVKKVMVRMRRLNKGKKRDT